jgi:hypothetical protein
LRGSYVYKWGQRGRVVFETFAILVRAMVAAEGKQSRGGIAAVAGVFAAVGQDKAASMVLSRIRADWPEELLDSSNVGAVGCRVSDTGAF